STVLPRFGWPGPRKEAQSVSDLIVGIDLGTTNSEVAAYVDGRVRVLGPGETRILPSCVGLSPDGKLLTGEPARNQQLLYPERTYCCRLHLLVPPQRRSDCDDLRSGPRILRCFYCHH